MQDKRTALMLAVQNESAQAPAVVEVLLEAGAEVDARDKASARERGWGRMSYTWVSM